MPAQVPKSAPSKRPIASSRPYSSAIRMIVVDSPPGTTRPSRPSRSWGNLTSTTSRLSLHSARACSRNAPWTASTPMRLRWATDAILGRDPLRPTPARVLFERSLRPGKGGIVKRAVVGFVGVLALVVAGSATGAKPGPGTSTGTASVFVTNPVQSLGDESLSDQKDADVAVPASAYVTVALTNLDG